MDKFEDIVIEDSVLFIHDGLGNDTDASKCDDECVGGTANTAAMEATKP